MQNITLFLSSKHGVNMCAYVQLQHVLMHFIQAVYSQRNVLFRGDSKWADIVLFQRTVNTIFIQNQIKLISLVF